jgi:hypothetical protein
LQIVNGRGTNGKQKTSMIQRLNKAFTNKITKQITIGS